jgi:ATP-dependent Zn protease
MRENVRAEAEADRSSILEKQNFLMKNRCKTTFKDVAGLEGPKKKYRNCRVLKTKYTNLGGKIPKGALL